MSVMDDTMIGRWLSPLPMDDPERKPSSKPMLRRFVNHDKPVKYIKYLGGGAEGAVWHVEIAGSEYALKVFKEWRYQGRKDIRERDRPYASPIAHEARAFARLDSMGYNGTFAVKCHGWMELQGYTQRPKEVRPYTRWAIVKDYLPNPVSLEDVPEIRQKMGIARKALLWPEDQLPRNYRGSFFVDLGRVRTYPYTRVVWSFTQRREYFDSFEKWVNDWEVSVRDGSVIEGWVNRTIKEAIEETKARKAKMAAEVLVIESEKTVDDNLNCSHHTPVEQVQATQA